MAIPTPTSTTAAPTSRPKKLSYKDQRDWDTLEARITETESQLAALEQESQRPEVASDAARVLSLHAQMTTLRETIDHLYTRWATLEAMLKGDGPA